MASEFPRLASPTQGSHVRLELRGQGGYPHSEVINKSATP
jgi:hypothetical protein